MVQTERKRNFGEEEVERRNGSRGSAVRVRVLFIRVKFSVKIFLICYRKFLDTVVLTGKFWNFLMLEIFETVVLKIYFRILCLQENI